MTPTTTTTTTLTITVINSKPPLFYFLYILYLFLFWRWQSALPPQQPQWSFFFIIFSFNYTNGSIEGTLPTNKVLSSREERWGAGLELQHHVHFFFLVICYYYTNKIKKSTPYFNTIKPPRHNQGRHYYHNRTTDGTGNKCGPYTYSTTRNVKKKNQETSSSTSPGHRSVVLYFHVHFFNGSFILGKAATSSPWLPLHQHQDHTVRRWAQGWMTRDTKSPDSHTQYHPYCLR